MKTLHYTILMAGIITLTACHDTAEELRYSSDPNAVHIQATVGTAFAHPLRKPASNPMNDQSVTTFNEGDKISLATEDQSAATYMLTNGVWQPTEHYLKWNKDSHTFTAYYPASAYTGTQQVPADQSTPDKIALADYMSFHGICNKTEDAGIKLQMQRQTARIVISGDFKWKSQYVNNSTPTHKVYSITINDSQTVISSCKHNGDYYALALPTEEANIEAVFLTIIVWDGKDENSKEELHIKGIPVLRAGYSYSYTLTLGKDAATIGSVTVLDWNTSCLLDGEGTTDEYVNLELNGHEYVDLGLPSGTLWATCNVGATNPEDYGDYFAWGEIAPKKVDYDWINYKWFVRDTIVETDAEGNETVTIKQRYTKYCTEESYGPIDNMIVLELEDDAAHMNWGGSWRMPTKAECMELFANCTRTQMTLNGVNGCKISSKAAGNTNYIFLPAAGYRSNADLIHVGERGFYWHSMILDINPYYGVCMSLDGDDGAGNLARCLGLSVRPVCSPR